MEKNSDEQPGSNESQQSEFGFDIEADLDSSDEAEPDEFWALVAELSPSLSLEQQAVAEYLLENQGRWVSPGDIVRDIDWPTGHTSYSSHRNTVSSTVAVINAFSGKKVSQRIVEPNEQGVRKYRLRFTDQEERDLQDQSVGNRSAEGEFPDEDEDAKERKRARQEGLVYSDIPEQARLERIISSLLAGEKEGIAPTSMASLVMEKGFKDEKGRGYSINDVVSAAARLARRNRDMISDTSPQGGRAYLLRRPN